MNINVTLSGNGILKNIRGADASDFGAVISNKVPNYGLTIFILILMAKICSGIHGILLSRLNTRFDLPGGGNKDCKLNFNHP